MTVRAGMAFLSYDKRGAGRSQGECCPGDDDHFNLLAADADGALEAARRAPGIDSRRVGFLGTSQAGWVVPLAIARNPDHVAFTALVDAPAVTTDEEHQWSDLAGEEAEHPPPLTPAKKREIERELRPSGFDPAPLLGRMTVPGIWLYGGAGPLPAGRSQRGEAETTAHGAGQGLHHRDVPARGPWAARHPAHRRTRDADPARLATRACARVMNPTTATRLSRPLESPSRIRAASDDQEQRHPNGETRDAALSQRGEGVA